MSESHSTGESSPIQDKKRVTNTEQFIAKARRIHGNTYAYGKAKYISSHDKVIITCLLHGEFEQKANGHLTGKGCKKCGIEKYTNTKRKSKDDFIAQANIVHNGFYSYEKVTYTNNKNVVEITCPLHGSFNQKPILHLQGVGCKKCAGLSKRITFDEFEQRSKDIHHSKYAYKKTKLEGNNTFVEMTCPIHGEFKQKIAKHLAGQGCPKCGESCRGWTRTSFQDFCDKHNNGQGFLYILKCQSNDEIFYKVGITSKKITRRFEGKKMMPYEYELLNMVKSQGCDIYDLETELHQALNEYRYEPKITFKGYTECFTTIEPIKDLLTKLEAA